MFTTYIKSLNDMVFSTVSLQVISTPACLCYAERCMAILQMPIYKQPLFIFTLDPKLALPSFVYRLFMTFALPCVATESLSKVSAYSYKYACLLTASACVRRNLCQLFLCFALVWEPQGGAKYWGLGSYWELVLSMEGKGSKESYWKCLPNEWSGC